MRILIHVGYPKTASTWFQKQLFPKQESFHFVERKDIVKYLISPSALNFNSTKVRDFFLNKYNENILLSLEGFIGTTHNFGMNGYLTKEHAQRLYSVFPDAEIVIFIRNQYDIIVSSYYQYIVQGGTYSIKKYLNSDFKGLNGITLFSYTFFEFDKTISLYKALFSEEHVYIFLFEEFNTRNVEFVHNFCKILNIRIDFIKINYMPENKKIRSITKVLYQFFNIFTSSNIHNKYFLLNIPYWPRIYRPLLRFLNRYSFMGTFQSSYKILGIKNYQYITNYFKESNNKLIHTYGLTKIKDYNYPI